jgi:tRNA wybutosine-synthesizing protein 2
MGFQQIGDIAIFNKNIDKSQALEFMSKFSRIRTVCLRTGTIKGQLRKPRVKVIATNETNKSKITETIHKESGIFYKLDARKVMFAKGNINERHRLVKEAKKNEIVLDMFAGIGYFSLPLAKKVKKVYSIELNPDSFYFLNENIKLNKLDNVQTILGDCSKVLKKLHIKADRISMGFLPDPFKFFKYTLEKSKKGTIIHYHCLLLRNNENEDSKKIIGKMNKLYGKSQYVKLMKKVFVKHFSPAKEHYVLDLKVI